jgi:acetylornithine deacetylase/succinyl-diaminopimelate desuccinylase-like protein
MNYEKTSDLIEEDFEKEIIPNLCEFIKIDNLSPFFDPEWNTNGKLETVAKFCLDWALNQNINGLKGEIIKDEDKTPLILIEIDANGSDKNILMYGHFDKQPHMEGWAEGLGPTTPVIKDGKLYGRGGADDGYSLFSSISAIKTIQTQGGKHGRVVIIIEGSEESGSPHLMPYLNNLKDRIGAPDLLICLDSGAKDYGRLWVTTSLRGMAILDLTVEVLKEGVHSGSGSGIGPDSFMIIRNILDRIQDSKTGKIVDDFHVEIPENRIIEAKKTGELLNTKVYDEIKFIEGVKPLDDDVSELILNNTWRPTLTITGQGGIPNYESAGNVLRASTTLRLSLRLPPTFNGEKGLQILEEIASKDPPYGAKITAKARAPGSGWNNKEYSSKLHESLNLSSKKLWGEEYYCSGEGGSIPFIKQLADAYPSCEIVVIGVLGPGSNAHSVNEFLHIDYCKNITATVAHTINDYSS